MENISWGEFISVWFPCCLILDLVFLYLNRSATSSKATVSEERKAKTRGLHTKIIDDVSYIPETKKVSMEKVEVLKPKSEQLPPPVAVECVDSAETEDIMTKEQTRNMNFLVSMKDKILSGLMSA